MTQQLEISDVLTNSVNDAVEVTKELFGLETVTAVIPFMKVVIAARSLTSEAHDELLKPLVKGILSNLQLDPVNKEEHRTIAADYAELIAMTISDATYMIHQNMQQQMQQRHNAQQALASGNGGLLKM